MPNRSSTVRKRPISLPFLATGLPVKPLGKKQAEPTGIPGAVHMEPSELEQAVAKIPRDRDVVVYCT